MGYANGEGRASARVPEGWERECWGRDLRRRSQRINAALNRPWNEASRSTPEENLAWWSRHWRSNIDRDQDSVIMVEGREGSGKSTLSLHAMMQMFPEIGVGELGEHVCWDLEIANEWGYRYKHTLIWWDEADNGGQALSFASPEAQAFLRLIRTMRQRHNVFIINKPVAAEFLRAARERRVEYFVRAEWDKWRKMPLGRSTVKERNWDLTKPLKEGDQGTWTRVDRNPIAWRPFPADHPMWLEYLRLKHEAYDRQALTEVLKSRVRAAKRAATVGEAAAVLEVSPRSVQNYCDQGMLEYFTTPGGQRRILIESLARLRAQTPRTGPLEREQAGEPSSAEK